MKRGHLTEKGNLHRTIRWKSWEGKQQGLRRERKLERGGSMTVGRLEHSRVRKGCNKGAARARLRPRQGGAGKTAGKLTAPVYPNLVKGIN